MTERNIAMEIAQAFAKADAQSLASLGYELLASLGEARATIAELRGAAAAKRDYDREYQRGRRKNRTTSYESDEKSDSPAFSPGPPFSPPTSTASTTARGVVWRPAMEAELARRLPSTPGKVALTAVLAKCANKTEAAAEIGMVLDGGRAGCSTKPEVTELALADYAANEDRWSSALYRGYVQRASRPDRQNGGQKGGPGQRVYDKIQESL